MDQSGSDVVSLVVFYPAESQAEGSNSVVGLGVLNVSSITERLRPECGIFPNNIFLGLVHHDRSKSMTNDGLNFALLILNGNVFEKNYQGSQFEFSSWLSDIIVFVG